MKRTRRTRVLSERWYFKTLPNSPFQCHYFRPVPTVSFFMKTLLFFEGSAALSVFADSKSYCKKIIQVSCSLAWMCFKTILHPTCTSNCTCLLLPHVPPPLARDSNCTWFVSHVCRLECASYMCASSSMCLQHRRRKQQCCRWKAGGRIQILGKGGWEVGKALAFGHVPVDEFWQGRLQPLNMLPWMHLGGAWSRLVFASLTSLHPQRPHPQPPHSRDRLCKHSFWLKV